MCFGLEAYEVKSGKKKGVWFALMVIAAIVLVVCVVAIGREIYELQLQKQADTKITLLARPSETPVHTATPEPTQEIVQIMPTSEPTASPVPQEIDFDALHQENEEIFAWIKVDGTRIDYPLLCRPDDDAYYHTHNVAHQKVTAGAIYIQGSVNSMELTDFHTVIYGHNMRNGSMFAGLHDFEEKDFFNAHDSVVIYTPERRLTYRIFAAYQRDDAHLMKKFQYDTVQNRQAFLDDVYSHSGFFREDVQVTTDSRILTLSTCVGGQDDQRYVVQAVLIADEPAQ